MMEAKRSFERQYASSRMRSLVSSKMAIRTLNYFMSRNLLTDFFFCKVWRTFTSYVLVDTWQLAWCLARFSTTRDCCILGFKPFLHHLFYRSWRLYQTQLHQCWCLLCPGYARRFSLYLNANLVQSAHSVQHQLLNLIWSTPVH
jgi:hypothetical protein